MGRAGVVMDGGGKAIRKNSAQRASSNPDHLLRFSVKSVRYDCFLSLSTEVRLDLFARGTFAQRTSRH